MCNIICRNIKQIKKKWIVRIWNTFDSLVRQYRCEETWGLRSRIVENFCGGGVGIEIGASCYPVPILKNSISIKYVDYRDRNEFHDSWYTEGQR